MKEKLLPIGSVVLLKGARKRLVISGFLMKDADSGIIYEYCGFAYPEGFIDNRSVAMFHHNQIEKIYHKGLEDAEEINYKLTLWKEDSYNKNSELSFDAIKDFEKQISENKKPVFEFDKNNMLENNKN